MSPPFSADLNAAVRAFERSLARMAGDGVVLETRLARGLPRVRVEPVQLERILMDLVVNARDSMPGGGRLTVSTAEDGADALLLIAHEGQGIDAATLSRAFEPPSAPASGGRGAGLGLSRVRRIVEHGGGSIAARGEPGEGAVLEVRFRTVHGQVGPAEPARCAFGGTETVLVAEPDGAVLRLAKMALEGRGYSVLEAASAEEALERIARVGERVHALLADVALPRMGGRELAARATAVRPGLKVVLMGGRADDVEGRVLMKPFTPEAVALAVREALDA